VSSEAAALPATLVARCLASLRRRGGTALEIHRRGGLRALLSHALWRAGYQRYIFFEAPLRPVVPPPAARIPLELGFLGADELDEIAAFRADLPREKLAERFRRGERCFVARSDGRVVAAYWIASADVRIAEIGTTLRVPPDAVYVGDAWTAPHLRGLGVAAAVSRAAKNRLADEGYERWVFYVVATNHLGLANARRTAPRETARIAALKLGPLPAVRVPYLG
jgi:GNAT superfamily N-acetyltransferase